MPIIPLITRTNPLANAAAPVLDRERRPTVDNRGIQQATGDLAKAGKMPDVPMSLAENPGLAAIGKALQQTGNVIGALAIKQREAETDIQVAGADSAMQAERAGFEEWKMGNPDPSAWKGEWERRLSGLQSKVLDDEKLHHGAREQIGLRMQRYAGHSTADVAMGAAKETFARAKSTFMASMDSATEAQDADGFQVALKTAEEKGYIYPHEAQNAKERFIKVGDQKRKEAEADTERAEYEVAVGAAIQDPNAWLEQNKEPWKDKPILWQRVKNAADNRQREGQGEFVREVTESIISGDITWESEIDAWESPHKTPALAEEAKRYLAGRDANAERKDREENGVRNAVELRQRVKDYDPAQDPDRTQYFELVREIGTRVEQSSAGEITGELYRKYGTEPPKLEVRPEIQRNVTKSLDTIFDPKAGAIPWRKEVPVLDSKGRPVKDFNGNPKVTLQEDQAARQRAIDAQTVIEGKMADFFRENPSATLPDVKKRLNELLPEGTEAAFFMNMKRSSAAAGGTAEIRGFAEAPDLPTKLPPGLRPHAQDYIDAAREYGLNPRVLAAISALETAGGTSKAFREKNNAMGISDRKGPVALASVRDSIFQQARTLARENGPYAKAKTLAEIGAIYAPPGAGNDSHGTNGGWTKNVSAWLAKL